jgi:ribosomal protein S18 acetylase RimI-like enzyme
VSTRIQFRPACAQDFEYCKRLYFAEMAWIIEELKLNRTAQTASFDRQWDQSQVRILMVDGADVGWMQSVSREGELFLAQIIVDATFQKRGIGTEAMNHLIAEAESARQALCLDVVKINPALRLYQRLGFRIVGEEELKFNMKRDPETPASLSS